MQDRGYQDEARVGPGALMRVLCCPNAFKGTLSAGAAAAALAAGVRDAGQQAVTVPMADGGDGTLDVLLAAAEATRIETVRVHGPLGLEADARLGWLQPAVAVVELAEAAGLRLLEGRLDALRASSSGAGELIRHGLDGGASRIVVGVGGSASTDGGAGLLMALGAKLRRADRSPIEPGGGGLADLATADLSGLDPRLRLCRLEVAVDVSNPLLGERGAAAVFGPQKGAHPAQVRQLEAGLTRLAEVLERDAGLDPAWRERPGTGAAGGTAYGLAAIGAELIPGAGLVADAVGLDAALTGCDLAITGEGRLDAQTASGKAPIEVARRAASAGVRCVAVAGVVESVPSGIAAAISLMEVAEAGEDPLKHPELLLRRAASRLLQQ